MEIQGHHSKERDDLYGEPMKPHAPMYRNPFPAVDVIIRQQAPNRIVLVRRKNPPHGWALPGGFVEYGESLTTAAVREAKEETGLDVTLTRLLHIYSAPDRDPRQHVISAVFVGDAEGTPVGADDAAEARVFSLTDLPPLAFDHAKILADYVKLLNTGERPML